MIRIGRWCDVTTIPTGGGGPVAFVYQRGTTVLCEWAASGDPIWAGDAKRDLLYLRAAADGYWRVCAIGVGQDDQAAIVIDGRAPILLGPVHGNYAVEIEGLFTGGWRAYIQRTPTTFDELTLSPSGETLLTVRHTMPATSQGFLDIREGVLITADAGRLAHGLVLPNVAAGVWAGQLPRPNGVALYDEASGRRATLFLGDSQPPHIARDSDGAFFVCAWRPQGAWVERYTWPFVADPIPDPEPDPDPEPEPEEPVSVPNYFDDVRAARDRYPAEWALAHKDYENQDRPGFTTSEEAERFIRRLAWDLHQKDRRIGLNGKRGTNTLSQDALCYDHGDGHESVIDVINAAGASNQSPGWNVVGNHIPAGPPNQKWIQPRALPGQPDPDPDPNPDPRPDPQPPADLSKLVAAVVAVQGVATAALAEVQQLRGEIAAHDGSELERYTNTTNLLKLISRQLGGQ